MSSEQHSTQLSINNITQRLPTFPVLDLDNNQTFPDFALQSISLEKLRALQTRTADEAKNINEQIIAATENDVVDQLLKKQAEKIKLNIKIKAEIVKKEKVQGTEREKTEKINELADLILDLLNENPIPSDLPIARHDQYRAVTLAAKLYDLQPLNQASTTVDTQSTSVSAMPPLNKPISAVNSSLTAEVTQIPVSRSKETAAAKKVEVKGTTAADGTDESKLNAALQKDKEFSHQHTLRIKLNDTQELIKGLYRIYSGEPLRIYFDDDLIEPKHIKPETYIKGELTDIDVNNKVEVALNKFITEKSRENVPLTNDESDLLKKAKELVGSGRSKLASRVEDSFDEFPETSQESPYFQVKNNDWEMLLLALDATIEAIDDRHRRSTVDKAIFFGDVLLTSANIIQYLYGIESYLDSINRKDMKTEQERNLVKNGRKKLASLRQKQTEGKLGKTLDALNKKSAKKASGEKSSLLQSLFKKFKI